MTKKKVLSLSTLLQVVLLTAKLFAFVNRFYHFADLDTVGHAVDGLEMLLDGVCLWLEKSAPKRPIRRHKRRFARRRKR